MIIWGSTGKEKTVGYGQFFCPQCASDTRYAHKRVSRYFTLYFIPLFRTATLGEYLQCDHCAGQFKSSILQVPREQLMAALQPWQCGNCGNNNPASSATCLGCNMPREMHA